MGNNFNTVGGSCNSPKLEQVQEERLKNVESLKQRHEYMSKLDIIPEFKDALNEMMDKINGELLEIMECEAEILAANDEVIALDSYRKRPVFEEIKKAA